MKNILLYGNSVALTGLAVSLQSLQNLRVTQSPDPTIFGTLTEPPDMVVIDTPRWSSPIAQLCIERNLLLVSLDADHGTLIALSGKSFSASSMQEVAQMLADLVSENA